MTISDDLATPLFGSVAGGLLFFQLVYFHRCLAPKRRVFQVFFFLGGVLASHCLIAVWKTPETFDGVVMADGGLQRFFVIETFV